MSNSTLSGMRQCSDKEYSKAKLCCLKCSAGFYKQKDCTETLATDCQPCKSDEYMDYQNHASYCLRCAYCGQAGSNLETIAPCTRTVNTQCRCRTGHYCSNWQDKRCERCKRVSSCGSGEGVNEKATLSADTKCETCPSGTFSNVSDTQSRCLGHTRCSLIGQVTLSPGTRFNDTKCSGPMSTGTARTPSGNAWIVPLVISSGIVLIAIFIIVISLRASRKRRFAVTRVDHHTTEMMDELLQVRFVEFLTETSKAMVERPQSHPAEKGLGIWGLEPAGPERAESQDREMGAVRPPQGHDPSLYIEVVKGIKPGLGQTPVYENLPPSRDCKSCACLVTGGGERPERRTASLSDMLLLGIRPPWMDDGRSGGPLSPSSPPGLDPGEAPSTSPRLLGCNHGPWGLREARSLRSLRGEDPDSDGLECDSARGDSPLLPPKTRPVAPPEAQARSQLVGPAPGLEEQEAQSLRSLDEGHPDDSNPDPGADPPRADRSPPTMTASEIFGQARQRRDRRSPTVLVSPPTPDLPRRPRSDNIVIGGGGERRGHLSLEVTGTILKAGSCLGELGQPPSDSNLQPEEDEWTE